MRRLSRILTLALLLPAGCASAAETVRFATFNSALSKDRPGALLETMRTKNDAQARAVAAVIQAARPDVLLLQEFDHGPGYDPDGEALRLFQENYLAKSQGEGLEPIQYEHVYLAPSNTGVPTGVDLNGDGLIAPAEGAEVGTAAYAADCHGYGLFPGQYAFVVLSRHPIEREGIRSFQHFLWRDLPGNHLPEGYYGEAARAVLRLSSKNHVNVPIEINGTKIHVLASHPTPPVFDGPEDRNGRRNYDEISLLIRRTMPYFFEEYRHTSDGRMVRNPPNPPVVVMGDLNADLHDGDSLRPAPLDPLPASTRPGNVCLTPQVAAALAGDNPPGAIEQLLEHERINADFTPTSPGGSAAAERDGGVNATHQTDPAADTADWHDQGQNAPGNLRVDYVLPSSDLEVVGGGVLWPAPDEPLMGVDLETVERASDHRLVWVDVRVE